jgi:hypothetical protein
MLTKTRLDDSVFEEMTRSPELAKMFLRDLESNALLLMKIDELRELEKKLPTIVYLRLREALEKRKIACREPYSELEAKRQLILEVQVGRDGVIDEFGRPMTPMSDYVESLPVHKRNSLRTGADQIQDREEFWKWVLEPLVNSLSPKNRVIDLVDQYLFQNVDKVLSEFRRSRKTSDLDSIGVNWLLKKIAKSSDGLPQKTRVNIFTAERPPRFGDPISKEEITFLIEEISPAWDIRFVDFYIYVVPKEYLNGDQVTNQLHGRRIVFNQRYLIGLDRGFDDLSVYWRGRSSGSVEDIDGSWFYLSNLASESDRHNTKLLRSTIPDDYVLELI